MIELGAQPVIHAVALGAVGGELKLNVVQRSGLVVLGMAAVTIGGHGGVVTQRTIFVTGVALDGGMRTEQWETIIVILDLLRLDDPALY